MSCTILWSTQSGRAKACARRARRILQESSIDSSSSLNVLVGGSLDEYTFARILEERRTEPASGQHVWIFLVSTTGDGEQCDTMRQTWQALLSRSLPSDLLQYESFALFALGDRAYGPQFCAGGRKLAARLVQLGATPRVPVGYGDDGTPNGGVFADFDDWLQKVLVPAFPQGTTRAGSSNNSSNDNVKAPVSIGSSFFDIQRSQEDNSSVSWTSQDAEWRTAHFRSEYQYFFSTAGPITAYNFKDVDPPSSPCKGSVLFNRRLTDPEWEQNTRHISIQVSALRRDGVTLPYRAGDVAAVMPVNKAEDVEKLLKVLPASIQSIADQGMKIIPTTVGVNSPSRRPWPHRCTLRGLLTYCADIQALPEREDLWELSFLCDLNRKMGQDQREKLVTLSDPSGAALYADYVLREKRTWADVLYDFDSVQMTLEALLDLLQPIRPREFSIASSPTLSSSGESFSVELCVAVVEGTTPLGRSYNGLCSSYLARLESTSSVHLWLRPGSFHRLPLTLSEYGAFATPVLCIGAGTGVAPLRSLILEREAVREQHLKDTGAPVVGDGRDNLLVFGCRKESMDYYYQEEWKDLIEKKRLALMTAFSRDQWHKIYVQQVVRDANEGALIATHILKNQGAIYVAGGAKMARCVKDEILECLAAELGEKQAAQLLKKLSRLGKYSVEAWS